MAISKQTSCSSYAFRLGLFTAINSWLCAITNMLSQFHKTLWITIFQKVGSAEVLERVRFALPSFHAYGHKPDCQVTTNKSKTHFVCQQLLSFLQVTLSPVRCAGLGMSDVEVMERLWSYLRRFSHMTKEMRPAHRTDILYHALLYYGSKTKQKLGNAINSWGPSGKSE